MIKESDVIKWLEQNCDFQFVDLPIFIYNEKAHSVNTKIINNLKSLKEDLTKPGISKVFIFKNYGKILFRGPLKYPGENRDGFEHVTTMRYYVIQLNKRYNLKNKKLK